MASTTNPTPVPAPANHTHRNTTSDIGSAALGSPRSRRSSAAARGSASSWTQMVRCGELESVLAATPSSPHRQDDSDWSPSKAVAASSLFEDAVAFSDAQPGSSDNGSGSGNNAAKKPAWNKPSNGASEVSPVMGAASWPALSESTKASPKSSSSDLLKVLSDGSVYVSQDAGITSSSPKQVSTNNDNSILMTNVTNHIGPTRQRSMKRGSANSSNNVLANGGSSQQQTPQGSEVEIAPNNSGKLNSGTDSSSWDNHHRDGGQRGGFGSQSHNGNEHQQQRNSYRRSNSGPHPRGDGTYHHGYGGRRDQERGNQDWNSHRGVSSRNAHMQPQRGPARPIIQGPPHTSPPFIPAPMSMHPYRTPMIYPEVPSPVYYVPAPYPDSLRMPMLAPVSPVFFQVPDPQLVSKIVNQIDYYFSNDNLIKDTFLRQNMDEQGWVPVQLIAGFKKVMQLTENTQLILDALSSSSVVEVQGEKLRQRNGWTRWIMPPSVQHSTMSSPRSLQNSSPDLLAEHLQSVGFDEKNTIYGNAELHLSRSSSAELSSPSKQSGYEMARQAGANYGQPMPVGHSSE